MAAEQLEEDQLALLDRLVRVEQGRGPGRAPTVALRAAAQFHAGDLRLLANERMATLLIELQNQVHRVRVLWPSTVTRLNDTWVEHARIVDALRARDGAEAERLMVEHLEKARLTALERILPTKGISACSTMDVDAAVAQALRHIDQDAVTHRGRPGGASRARPDTEREAASFLAEYMAAGGLEVTLQEVGPNRATPGGHPARHGRRPPPDVQRPPRYLHHRDRGGGLSDDRAARACLPDKGFVQDGHVLGCGAYNMKGGVAAMVSAALAVKAAGVALRGDLVVAAVAGEIEKAPVKGLLRTYAGEAYNGGRAWHAAPAQPRQPRRTAMRWCPSPPTWGCYGAASGSCSSSSPPAATWCAPASPTRAGPRWPRCSRS